MELKEALDVVLALASAEKLQTQIDQAIELVQSMAPHLVRRDYTLLTESLKPWEIRKEANSNAQGAVGGVISVDVGEIAECGRTEEFLTLLSTRIVGDDSFGEIEYSVVGHEGDNIHLSVYGNPTGLKEDLVVAQCDNCELQFLDDELIKPIPDLEQRVAPGEEMPCGECPACGAVCHPLVERDYAVTIVCALRPGSTVEDAGLSHDSPVLGTHTYYMLGMTPEEAEKLALDEFVCDFPIQVAQHVVIETAVALRQKPAVVSPSGAEEAR